MELISSLYKTVPNESGLNPKNELNATVTTTTMAIIFLNLF